MKRWLRQAGIPPEAEFEEFLSQCAEMRDSAKSMVWSQSRGDGQAT
jgi:hypothetical protein